MRKYNDIDNYYFAHGLLEEFEIKPCPFCGGKAELRYGNDNHHRPLISCRDGCFQEPKCPMAYPYLWTYQTVEEAVEAWNRRAAV